MSALVFPIKNKAELVKKTRHLWECTYLQPTQGWPGKWTVIWRSSEYHGKISGSIESKERPDERQVERCLTEELKQRFESNSIEDAKRVARLYFFQPVHAELEGCRKEIERIVTRGSDELAKALEPLTDNPLVNELFQRIKDIASAQETSEQIDKLIDNKGGAA